MYVCRHFGKRWHRCDFQVVATSTSPTALIEGDEKSIQSWISGLGNDSISIPKWNTQSRMVVNPTRRDTIIVDERSIPVLNERNSAAACGQPKWSYIPDNAPPVHQWKTLVSVQRNGSSHLLQWASNQVLPEFVYFQSLSVSGLHHKPWIQPPFCRIFGR